MENKNMKKENTSEVVLLKESTRNALVSILSMNLEAAQESSTTSVEDMVHRTLMTRSLKSIITELGQISTQPDADNNCEKDCESCTFNLLMTLMVGPDFECPGKQQGTNRPKSRRVNVAYDNNMN